MDKLKCHTCGKKGEDLYYIWTRGHLHHVSCYLEIDWEVNKNNYVELGDVELIASIERLITKKDIEEYKRNPNYVNCLIGKLYKELRTDPTKLRELLDNFLASKK
jgi:hypothetical protein